MFFIVQYSRVYLLIFCKILLHEYNEITVFNAFIIMRL